MLLNEILAKFGKDTAHVMPSCGYAGIDALQKLPEVKDVSIENTEDEKIVVKIESKDDYSIQVTLRKPTQSDFLLNSARLQTAASQRELIVEDDVVLQNQGNEVRIIEEFCKGAHLDPKDITVSVLAHSPHLSKVPRVSNVFARNLYYATESGAGMASNTSNHPETNSVLLSALPIADLLLFSLVHELVELSNKTSEVSERLASAIHNMWASFDQARLVCIEHGLIDKSMNRKEVISKMNTIAFTNQSIDLIKMETRKFACKYATYKLIQLEESAEKERITNTLALDFLLKNLPGIEERPERKERLQTMSDVCSRGHAVLLELYLKDIKKQSCIVTGIANQLTQTQDFLNRLTYSSEVGMLDQALHEWREMSKYNQ